MDPEFRSHRIVDRYGMLICPRGEAVEASETTESSDNENPLAKKIKEAISLCKQKKYTEALKIFEPILKKRIVTLGHDHPDTCYARNGVAHLHLKLKNYDEAFKLHYQIKSAFSDRCNLIFELYHEGEYIKALRFTQRIYDHIKEVSNPRDPEGLKIRTITANIYAALNKYREALKIYEDIYQKYFHKDGPDHPDTLTILRRIGLVLQDQGKFDEARKTFKDVLDKRRIKLGRDHEDTLTSHKDIAELLIELGRYDKALDIYRDVHTIERNIRPEHPATLNTRCEIAKVLCLKGLYNNALDILKDVYDIQRANRRYLDVRVTLNLAARVLKGNGKPRAALTVFMKLCETEENPNHIDTLDTEYNIASMLLTLDEYDDAREIFNSLFYKFSEILGPEHRKTLDTQSNIARILFLKGELDGALKMFNIICEIQERKDFLGPDHPATMRTKLNIAEVYAGQEKFEEALEIYNEVLKKKELMFNADHPDILQIECDIAGVYSSQTYYNKSFQLYYKVYEKKARILGDTHRDTLAVERIMDLMSREMPSEKLLVAAHRNELKTVESCVEKGDDINVRDIDGSVALHLASKKGYLEVIEYLLDKGAIYNLKNREGKKPVDVAKNDETKHLFNAFDALLKAIKSGNYPSVVRLTEEDKASINAKDEAGCTPLHWAASMGCRKTVTFLLEKGADFTSVTKNGNTALHLLASRNYNEVAETLLLFVEENKPEKLSKFVNAQTTVFGTTSLHSAAQNNHYGLLKLLLQYGADTRIRNKFGKLPVDLTTKRDIRTMLIAWDEAFY